MLPLPADLSCAPAQQVRAWAPAAATSSNVVTTPPQADPVGLDYRQALKPSPAGWPHRHHWCVWVEPSLDSGPTGVWQHRWQQAVMAALATWQELLPLTLVSDPSEAQVLVERRRPPILNQRASHGRALLQLLEVQRSGQWRLEPRVQVLISPGQAQPAIQATALHELGHAFGLWGHSDQPADAMASRPGSKPVLQLSPRDRATLEWLHQQPALGGNGQP